VEIKILSVVGARPNFMKIAPIISAIKEYNHKIRNTVNSIALTNPKNSLNLLTHILVHTGQHYDDAMSDTFFKDLDLPKPDIYLGIGSASHAEQTAEIMKRFEKVLLEEKPNVVIVVGDVNSTLACALVASKIEYPATQSTNEPTQRRRPLVAHVEAGLRSFDRSMPEEINRVLTDALSDLLFVTEKSGIKNLRNEGIAKNKIHFVGNVMIDTLKKHIHIACFSKIKQKLKIKGPYGLVTLHRPNNVDSSERLSLLLGCIKKISCRLPLIFPLHPRTKNNLINFEMNQYLAGNDGLITTDPLGYHDFLNLLSDAKLVLTDSGGIQEETTFLKIPCITLRNNTERPVTVELGTNYLVGIDVNKIFVTAIDILEGRAKRGVIPPYWDGNAATRIIKVLTQRIFS